MITFNTKTLPIIVDKTGNQKQVQYYEELTSRIIESKGKNKIALDTLVRHCSTGKNRVAIDALAKVFKQFSSLVKKHIDANIHNKELNLNLKHQLSALSLKMESQNYAELSTGRVKSILHEGDSVDDVINAFRELIVRSCSSDQDEATECASIVNEYYFTILRSNPDPDRYTLLDQLQDVAWNLREKVEPDFRGSKSGFMEYITRRNFKLVVSRPLPDDEERSLKNFDSNFMASYSSVWKRHLKEQEYSFHLENETVNLEEKNSFSDERKDYHVIHKNIDESKSLENGIKNYNDESESFGIVTEEINSENRGGRRSSIILYETPEKQYERLTEERNCRKAIKAKEKILEGDDSSINFNQLIEACLPDFEGITFDELVDVYEIHTVNVRSHLQGKQEIDAGEVLEKLDAALRDRYRSLQEAKVGGYLIFSSKEKERLRELINRCIPEFTGKAFDILVDIYQSHGNLVREQTRLVVQERGKSEDINVSRICRILDVAVQDRQVRRIPTLNSEQLKSYVFRGVCEAEAIRELLRRVYGDEDEVDQNSFQRKIDSVKALHEITRMATLQLENGVEDLFICIDLAVEDIIGNYETGYVGPVTDFMEYFLESNHEIIESNDRDQLDETDYMSDDKSELVGHSREVTTIINESID